MATAYEREQARLQAIRKQQAQRKAAGERFRAAGGFKAAQERAAQQRALKDKAKVLRKASTQQPLLSGNVPTTQPTTQPLIPSQDQMVEPDTYQEMPEPIELKQSDLKEPIIDVKDLDAKPKEKGLFDNLNLSTNIDAGAFSGPLLMQMAAASLLPEAAKRAKEKSRLQAGEFREKQKQRIGRQEIEKLKLGIGDEKTLAERQFEAPVLMPIKDALGGITGYKPFSRETGQPFVPPTNTDVSAEGVATTGEAATTQQATRQEKPMVDRQAVGQAERIISGDDESGGVTGFLKRLFTGGAPVPENAFSTPKDIRGEFLQQIQQKPRTIQPQQSLPTTARRGRGRIPPQIRDKSIEERIMRLR